jgi:hypothetical protein
MLLARNTRPCRALACKLVFYTSVNPYMAYTSFDIEATGYSHTLDFSVTKTLVQTFAIRVALSI